MVCDYMQNYLPELKASISSAVSRSVENTGRIGILFSGGLDSSLIAFLARNRANKADIMLYTVGTANSYDLINAEHASKLLGIVSKKIEISNEDIINAIPKLGKIIESKHPVKISFELPMFLGMERVVEKLVISGQGADELFGGYARYLNMNKGELRTTFKKDLKTLINDDIKMDYRIAGYFGKDLKLPYLDEDVVEIAEKIPIELKVNNGKRKIILKKVAKELGLPEELVQKEKKAAQYSSGIIKDLRKMAKKEKMGVNEYIEHLIQG